MEKPARETQSSPYSHSQPLHFHDHVQDCGDQNCPQFNNSGACWQARTSTVAGLDICRKGRLDIVCIDPICEKHND